MELPTGMFKLLRAPDNFVMFIKTLKNLCFVAVAAFVIISCSYGHRHRKLHISIKALAREKDSIDNLSSIDSDSLRVFVKMTGKDQLVRIYIYNGKFPEDSIECTYNVLLLKGKVAMIMLSPYDDSGDWDADCTHYFYANGHTLAFEERSDAFGDLPDDNVVYETITNYFNDDFVRIKHFYKLTDKNNKPLGKEYAFGRGAFDSKTYPTADECLKAYHIDKSNL